MINIISSVVLLVISISQLNIFEIDGVFSSAHVRSIERHIEETQYTQNDLLVIQYSSTKYSEKAVADFEKLITCLLYTSPSPRDQRGSRMPSSA